MPHIDAWCGPLRADLGRITFQRDFLRVSIGTNLARRPMSRALDTRSTRYGVSTRHAKEGRAEAGGGQSGAVDCSGSGINIVSIAAQWGVVLASA